ncbi:MAG TPA: type IV pilus assembly protein PilM [Candidatus Saccharimonadales bacterium]|nr:type IV pilus assembly protein PilM [Candidatus Saccharimonadales bacterium]
MGSTTKTTNFFRNKPLFGLDIGNGSLKVMQVDDETVETKGKSHRQPRVIGYGTASFDKAAIDNGVIVQPEIIARATLELFRHHLIGDITARRAAIAIPTYRTFIRSVQLPLLKPKELKEAVSLEAEQYIPMALDELYMDYEQLGQVKEQFEVLAVAVPRKIVDSHLELMHILGLDAVLIEPTMAAAGRLFTQDTQSDVPTVIIDFGSLSSDIAVFDGKILATGTVPGGGMVFTNSIKDKLKVTQEEAGLIKTKYGMGVSKHQKEIREALEPTLDQIVKELRRMIRYYDERYGAERPVKQLITLGGGANMPGLSEYLTNELRLAVRPCDPWQYFNYKGLQPPGAADKSMYATVAGLSLVPPHGVFAK